MRVTIDLMKKSTQIIDLSNVINPRVGDDDLLLPLHIIYGDNLFDMRGKDVEFLSNDPNKKNIYIAGTCNTNTPGDNLYMGDLTFRFPAGTFKADGTYDPDKTMFRIVDKETQKVISSVNVKITVMKNNIEFDFDPDKSSYDSRLETMLHDFHDKGQAMLDEIKGLNNQAKSNVSGNTATTAKEAKKQADQNAGDISDLKGEVAGARGRFADMAGREDAQDTAISQKESIVNANANYAALQRKNAQQDSVLAQKAGKFELEAKLAQMDLQPEGFENEAALKAEYPNGKAGIMVTVDTGHKWIWINGAWEDCGIYQAKDLSDDDRNKLETSYHHAIAAGNPTNLIYNANLLTKDMTGWVCKDYPEAASFDDTNRYQGIASIKITQSGLTESKYTFVESDQFKVVSGQPYYFKVTAKGINTDSGVNSYSAQVFFEDSQGKILDGTGTTNQGFQTDWNILSCSGMVPATAETAFVRLILRQNGTVFFSHPVFALRKTEPLTTDDLLPIIETKKSEAINDAHKFVTNNQLDIPQDDFPSSWIAMDSRVSVQNSIIKIENPNGTDSDYVSCFSNSVALSNDRIFIGYSVETNGCDGINSYPFVQLYFYKSKEDAISNVNGISQQDWHWFTTTPGLYQQNPVVSENKWTDIDAGSFAVPKEANYVRIQYILKGKGTVYFTNLSEYNKGVSPEKFSLPVLYLNGNLSTVTKDTIAKAAFSYKDGEIEKDGYLTIKWQGASSLNYPKKNWNLKLFSDADFTKKLKMRMKADWANNNSYMLKADWIDATHARNLVNADLWKQLTLSRAVLRNNPINYVQHSDMPYIDQMSGLDVKHTIYHLDKGFYGKTATVSFDLTTDSAGGDFHLAMSHQAHDLVTDNIQSGTHHYSKTITFGNDEHPDEISRLSMIVNNHAGNFKLENMALVLGDKEIPDADNPVDSVTKLRKAPNAGTIQGFPILLVINGTPQGLYNFDSKKNNDLWNVDDKDSKNYVVISDDPAGTLATDNPEFGEGKYNFEVPDNPTDMMKNQFTALARFINSSSDEEFKAQAADKVDIMAAVDQYLFNSYTTMIDAGAKSDVYITYNNGKYWIPSFYDFDSTWGLKADGSAIDDRYIMTWGASPTSSFMMSKLQIRVRDNFPELVKARWNELKNTIFNPAHITAMFENYISQIDQHYYELDQEIWPNIPSLKTANRRQLQQFIADRWNVMNDFYA